MDLDTGIVALAAVSFLASVVTGALGYGFSSLTVPVALLFFANRILNPALVLIEVVLNAYALVINRAALERVWPRVRAVVLGLLPGVVAGAWLLSFVHPGWMRMATFLVILPLLYLQAAGVRRPLRSTWWGLPAGGGIGLLYSVTTISGPPLALLFNNQGLAKEDFRAGLAIVRTVESTLTAIAYLFLGLYTFESAQLIAVVTPGVLVGLPLGALLIARLEIETFRRICMSFDVWVVSFGLCRVLDELRLMTGLWTWDLWLALVLLDVLLLIDFFANRRGTARAMPELR